MKKVTTALIALLGLVAFDLQGQTVGNFDDIQFWTGSGTNRAALVLQWNDGETPASLAWGYRWNGAATGFDMITAIAGASTISDTGGTVVETLSGSDPRIALGMTRYGPNFDAVQSIAFSATGGLRFQEGFNDPYWGYYVFGGTFEYFDWNTMDTATYSFTGNPSYADVLWLSSPVGAVDRPLSDGSWDAWNFGLFLTPAPVQQPQAARLPVPALTFRWTGGNPEIGFSSVAGLSYQLAFTDNLGVAFAPMGKPVVATGGPMVFTDESSPRPPQRFYRIAVSP